MMNLKLIKLGKTQESYKEICLPYQKRLKGLCPLETLYLKDQTALVKYLKKESNITVILCDERGQAFDSLGFSSFLFDKLETSRGPIALVVGDAYGFSAEFRQSVPATISLSAMVLANEVAWLMLNEQVYRAFMIKTGHAYHHGDLGGI